MTTPRYRVVLSREEKPGVWITETKEEFESVTPKSFIIEDVEMVAHRNRPAVEKDVTKLLPANSVSILSVHSG